MILQPGGELRSCELQLSGSLGGGEGRGGSVRGGAGVPEDSAVCLGNMFNIRGRSSAGEICTTDVNPSQTVRKKRAEGAAHHIGAPPQTIV